MMVAASAKRSSNAAVSFSSPPNTLGHSLKFKLVVITTDRRPC